MPFGILLPLGVVNTELFWLIPLGILLPLGRIKMELLLVVIATSVLLSAAINSN